MSQTVTVFSSPYGAKIGETKETAFVFISLRSRVHPRSLFGFLFISLRSKIHQSGRSSEISASRNFSSPYGERFSKHDIAQATRNVYVSFHLLTEKDFPSNTEVVVMAMTVLKFSSPYGERFSKRSQCTMDDKAWHGFHLLTEKDLPKHLQARVYDPFLPCVFISIRSRNICFFVLMNFLRFHLLTEKDLPKFKLRGCIRPLFSSPYGERLTKVPWISCRRFTMVFCFHLPTENDLPKTPKVELHFRKMSSFHLPTE